MAQDVKEKMIILNMLQEGKINAEEASRLLASLEQPAKGKAVKPAKSDPKTKTEAFHDNDGGVTHKKVEKPERPPEPVAQVEKAEKPEKTFMQKTEPQLKKFTEVVAGKTVDLTSRLGKVFSGMPSPAAYEPDPRSPSGAPAASGTGTEQHIELLVNPGYNELNLEAFNGELRIKGYNGDKITAKIRYKGRGVPQLMKLGTKYYLHYEQDDFSFVAIDAYVPCHLFNVMKLTNTNGLMDISALECAALYFENTNGKTVLHDLTAETLKSETNNGFLSVSEIKADDAHIEHVNGVLEAADIQARKLYLSNFNGTLQLVVTDFSKYEECVWNVETSNAKLVVNLPTMQNLGYHLRANSSLGSIKVGLTGLEYSINEPGLIEARTAQYHNRPYRVQLSLETSNAPLIVN